MIIIWLSFALQNGSVEPMQFTSKLQVELKSSPQPYLIPFLKVGVFPFFFVRKLIAPTLPIPAPPP